MIKAEKVKPIMIPASKAENEIVSLYKEDQDGCNDWNNGYNQAISDAQDVILGLYDKAAKGDAE